MMLTPYQIALAYWENEKYMFPPNEWDELMPRITRKNGDEYIGTAKVINRRTDKTSNVERTARNGSIQTDAFTPFDSRVRIEIVSYRVRLADADGVSAKYAIDGLVNAGVIKDDSTKYVEAVTYRQVKVKHKSQEQTEIIIEEIE